MKFFTKLLPNIKDVARATVFPFSPSDSKRRFVAVYFIRLVFLVSQRLWRDRCPRQAAALSFQTMLSVVPVAAVAVSVASLLSSEFYIRRILNFLKANLLPEAASKVGTYIVKIASSLHLTTLGIVGGGALLLVAMTLLFNVEQVVSEIFRCKNKRSFFKRFSFSLLLLLCVPPGIGFSLYFTRNMLALPGFANTAFPLFLTVVSLTLCYWLLPRTSIKIGYAAISAVIAGIGFEALKIGFALYAKYLGATLSYVYGAFAILPLFMIWIYTVWMMFLFGAELNASLHEVKRRDRFEQLAFHREPSSQSKQKTEAK